MFVSVHVKRRIFGVHKICDIRCTPLPCEYYYYYTTTVLVTRVRPALYCCRCTLDKLGEAYVVTIRENRDEEVVHEHAHVVKLCMFIGHFVDVR